MYANPIHPGHIECLELSKKIVDHVWVIVNNDKQAELKRGIPSFQDEEFRIKVLESIKYVDKVLLSIDLDSTVVQSIETAYYLIKQQDKDAEIIFTKGGDRFANEIPESSICTKLGIKIIDNLGEKIYHSSNIIPPKNNR
jgi:D-beta-D-heptose 7-phosphate kinase/D-beta-D-heptose 1-phosphate adenosyltransferase